MDIASILEYVNIVVMGICLCIGYVIKISLNFIPNKYIPLIMLVLGTILNILFNLHNITGCVILTGMLSGLASTGTHEMIKNIFTKKSE